MPKGFYYIFPYTENTILSLRNRSGHFMMYGETYTQSLPLTMDLFKGSPLQAQPWKGMYYSGTGTYLNPS